MSELQEGIAAQEGGVSARSGAVPAAALSAFSSHSLTPFLPGASRRTSSWKKSWVSITSSADPGKDWSPTPFSNIAGSREAVSNRSMQFAMLRDNTTVLPNQFP
jgi:hypothetical protein